MPVVIPFQRRHILFRMLFQEDEEVLKNLRGACTLKG